MAYSQDNRDNLENVDTATAARLSGLSIRQVQRWRKLGVVGGPDGRLGFVDLRLLRSFASILKLGVPARRLYRALEQHGLPANSLTTDGQSLLYRRDLKLWNAETGQGHIDFDEVQRAPQSATPLSFSEHTSKSELPTSVEQWYELAFSLEQSDPKAAQDIYLRAIHTDPGHVASRINLGRLRQLRGNISAAVRQYREALRLDPKNPEALYNLATVFDDLEECDVAIKYYQIASRNIPEAHLHLVRLYEEQKDTMRARWHLAAWQTQAFNRQEEECDKDHEGPADEED